MRWRCIGPFRGGRTVGAAGVPGQPNVFYIGVNNGGVWKTTDYGRIWTPIFDDQPTGSIGALAVAPSNPNIIYVGSGEGLQRPDLVRGDGVYKSTDAGKTWTHLRPARRPADRRDSRRPEGPEPRVRRRARPSLRRQRGARRLSLHRRRPAPGRRCSTRTRTRARSRSPSIRQTRRRSTPSCGPRGRGRGRTASGKGRGSGLFKSTDGGTTWRQLTQGLPTFEQGLGRIGIGVAPSQSQSALRDRRGARQAGGVYRSDDAGESWRRVNGETRVWGRGVDFAEVKVDPRNPDVVYVANIVDVPLDRRRQDLHRHQGRARRRRLPPHLDQPREPADHPARERPGRDASRVNGGADLELLVQPADRAVLSRHHRQPVSLLGLRRTAGERLGGRRQPRRLRPDHLPRLAPRRRRGIRLRRARSARTRTSSTAARSTRFDQSNHRRSRTSRPSLLRTGKYRFLRTAPLIFSPVDPHALFYAGNVLFKTTNGGQSWEVISPDLTREASRGARNLGIFRTPELKTMPRRGVDLHRRAVLQGRQRHLGGHRRRPDPRHPRRRQDLDRTSRRRS